MCFVDNHGKDIQNNRSNPPKIRKKSGKSENFVRVINNRQVDTIIDLSCWSYSKEFFRALRIFIIMLLIRRLLIYTISTSPHNLAIRKLSYPNPFFFNPLSPLTLTLTLIPLPTLHTKIAFIGITYIDNNQLLPSVSLLYP
ncbi:hypothetical protein RIR_jg3845.t1 [Rhizophagus irregularis DAOM 181602=DAOM 197198]|nr:hypothetical protein RIR_jg3845.t1 [Rhizophagus irregularis DAOM 181602=DAOM 197198]